MSDPGDVTAGVMGGLAQPGPAASERRSRAIVIGLNEYQNANKLENPVRDACRFAEWLVKKAGVNVADIALLTSPAEIPANAPRIDGLVPLLADRETLLQTIQEFPERAGDGERLYFYFSGHGTAYQPRELRGTVDQQDGIVPCDYKKFGSKPIPTNWILDWMQASPYAEQFFFFDACRNLAKVAPERGDDPPDIPASRLFSPIQYLLFSTAPRRVSLDRIGTFSDTLLAALTKGQGSSAMFDQARKRYLVRWDGLAQFLIDFFQKTPVRLGFDNDRPVLQQPERDVLPNDLGGDSPFLVALDPSEVGSRTLTIEVLPPELRPGARITIISATDGAQVVQQESAPADRSFEKSLAPGRYMAMVQVDDPPLLQFSGLIELVEDRSCTFTLPFTASRGLTVTARDGGETMRGLDFGLPAAPPGPIVMEREEAVPSTAERGLSFEPDVGPRTAGAGSASLTVKASDRFTLVEVLDASGSMVRWRDGRACSALENVTIDGLEPGSYRVRFHPQDGPMTERIVALSSGTHKEVDFIPPAPAEAPLLSQEVSRVIEATRTAEEDTRALELEPELDLTRIQAAAPGPTTFIVQAMREMDNDPAHAALLSRSLGLDPFPGSEGLRVVLGVDLSRSGSPQEALSSVKVSLGRLDDATFDVLSSEDCHIDGVKVFTVATAPGPYRLRIDRPGDRAEFAVVVLKDRTWELLLEQEAGGRTSVTQFAPLTSGSQAPDAETFFKIARLELALQGGPSRTAPALLADLTAAGVAEPMVLLLHAYMTCIGGNPKRLRDAGTQLIERYPDLPDGYVALGRSAEAEGGNDEAQAAFLQALERGLPILAKATKELNAGIRRLKITGHPRLQLLREATTNQMGLLWNAWLPPLENGSRPEGQTPAP